MELINEQTLSQAATRFFGRNYDYLWLRTMLEQAANTKASGATLITGSSHALNGIKESYWSKAFNCSMHSQDISMTSSAPGECWNGPKMGALPAALLSWATTLPIRICPGARFPEKR